MSRSLRHRNRFELNGSVISWSVIGLPRAHAARGVTRHSSTFGPVRSGIAGTSLALGVKICSPNRDRRWVQRLPSRPEAVISQLFRCRESVAAEATWIGPANAVNPTMNNAASVRVAMMISCIAPLMQRWVATCCNAIIK